MSPGVLQVCSSALCPVCVIHAEICTAGRWIALPDNISMLLLCALHEQDADGCALLPILMITPWKAPLMSVHSQRYHPSAGYVCTGY